MGESVLRRTASGWKWGGSQRRKLRRTQKGPRGSKGNPVKIPEPAHGLGGWSLSKGAVRQTR